MTRSRPFVGSLAFRLLLLAFVPFFALALLANERISVQRDQKHHAEALVDVIAVRGAVVGIYGPKHVERIAMEGMARIDELGYPRPLVVAATGIDFESIERENHAAFDDALDALQTGCGDLVLSDGGTLGPRLGEVRADIATLRSELSLRSADPRAVGAAFDRLDAVLSDVLDSETTVDLTGDDHETTGESNQHERLRALAAVVDSAGGRGNELLASILYEDDDRIYEVVRANGRHAALTANYRDLLIEDEAAEFDAVQTKLVLLPPSELQKVADFDMTTFDTELITTAVDSLYNHRDYLVALDTLRGRDAPADGGGRTGSSARRRRCIAQHVAAAGGRGRAHRSAGRVRFGCHVAPAAPPHPASRGDQRRQHRRRTPARAGFERHPIVDAHHQRDDSAAR